MLGAASQRRMSAGTRELRTAAHLSAIARPGVQQFLQLRRGALVAATEPRGKRGAGLIAKLIQHRGIAPRPLQCLRSRSVRLLQGPEIALSGSFTGAQAFANSRGTTSGWVGLHHGSQLRLIWKFEDNSGQEIFLTDPGGEATFATSGKPVREPIGMSETHTSRSPAVTRSGLRRRIPNVLRSSARRDRAAISFTHGPITGGSFSRGSTGKGRFARARQRASSASRRRTARYSASPVAKMNAKRNARK